MRPGELRAPNRASSLVLRRVAVVAEQHDHGMHAPAQVELGQTAVEAESRTAVEAESPAALINK